MARKVLEERLRSILNCQIVITAVLAGTIMLSNERTIHVWGLIAIAANNVLTFVTLQLMRLPYSKDKDE